MPSITTWNRLEPYPYSESLRPALRADLHDPLWLLARQWQLNEFEGEDNGSPLWVELVGEYTSLKCYRAGGTTANWVEYEPNGMPLEELIEAEPPDPLDFRLRVESGAHFIKLLGDLAKTYRSAYLTATGLEPLKPTDAVKASLETRRLVALMAKRVIDGMRLYEITAGEIAGVTADTPEDGDKLKQIVVVWRNLYAPLFEPAVQSAWAADRLEYSFSVASPMTLTERNGTKLMDETVLQAEGYAGGHLDWPAFNIAIDTNLDHAMRLPEDNKPVSFNGPPSPLHYPGMPVTRFWQFEDGRVNFGAVDAAADDLGRALLLNFALVYGNDFFLVPLELPVGALCRISSLKVKNTFGEETDNIEAAASMEKGTWKMFTLSAEGGSVDNKLFFLPPSLGVNLEGQVMEEVSFARDEMANLVWAIERQVTGALHQAVHRHEQWAQRSRTPAAQTPAAANGEMPARYHLISEVPDYWYPMELEATDEGRLRLRVYNQARQPQGRLLTESSPFELHEEEVPRSGVRVRRAYQYARWIDGSHRIWIGRRKEVGRGEASSQLRFDYVDTA